jgi:alginate O-acetyltransferase complex protein AlgI
VGISFYTFQSMGYVIDIYRRKIPACRAFLEYQAFVSFFPQLVAGPIERAGHMLPQFHRVLPIRVEQVESGVWLIIIGLFKKIALADNFAPLVALVYDHSIPSAATVFLGTVAFAAQIYCDFSGYSDIARGLAKLLGFELMLNFNLPYTATSMRDFWNRWHISLSHCLRDYLYIPLGGSRRGEARCYLNLAVTMLICGLWHGASLTFVLWGLWHGLGLIINRWYIRHTDWLPRLPRWFAWSVTMLFVLYGWMLFRASSLDSILVFNRALADFSLPNWLWPFVRNLVVLIIPLVLIELKQRRADDPSAPVVLARWPRAALQAALLLTVIVFWEAEPPPFIYFQF